jgi:hypothetical protein
MTEENRNDATPVPPATPATDLLADDIERPSRPGWREIFQEAFDKARRAQHVTNRSDLRRDRSRSLILLVVSAIVVMLFFLGVFSSPNSPKPKNNTGQGTPNLGRGARPGQQATGQGSSVTPLLNAQTGQPDFPGQDITPEEVGRTAHPVSTTAPIVSNAAPYALGNIDFSDPRIRQAAVTGTTDDLKKSSLIFIRGVQPARTSIGVGSSALEEAPQSLALPPGTKLIARLQSVVNSASKAPVTAAIEYNYEKGGEIVVPAGATVSGSLQQADRSGDVAIRFDAVQFPDGTSQKMDATAMSLTYGPLKGNVSGKKTGTRFLVRAFTGLGTMAAYLVGSNGFNGPLSNGALLREQIATNVGAAGDQELNALAFNQNIIVTIPANTRFYVVIQKGMNGRESDRRTAALPQTRSMQIPTIEELRQLLQLKQELQELYQQPEAPNAGATEMQQ